MNAQCPVYWTKISWELGASSVMKCHILIKDLIETH